MISMTKIECEGETVLKAAAIISKKVDIAYYTDRFYHFSKLVDMVIEFLRQPIPFVQTYTVCYLNQYIIAYPNIKYIFVLSIDWHMLNISSTR